MRILITKLTAVLCALSVAFGANAQEHFRLNIREKLSGQPIAGASFEQGGRVLAVSDSLGNVKILLNRIQPITIVAVGFARLDYSIKRGDSLSLNFELEPMAEQLETVTIIASTRSNMAIELSPLKVEVLGQEEMSEEAAIKPGNIASILGDVSGVQIQQSSAVSGNSNVRIQGLDGRYTQILRDGMPMFEGFSGGFGILTIPPLDLKQIELIKGAASTLFGGGAIGGLVNLISRRPTKNQDADAVLNYSTLGEFNANTYLAKRKRRMGYTLFSGYTKQQAKDVNGDGFSDVAKSESVLFHPRLFFYPGNQTVISVGYNAAFDGRTGGDMMVLTRNPEGLHQFFEHNKSNRQTGDYLIEQRLHNGIKFTLNGSFSRFDKQTRSGTENTAGQQDSYFNELSVFTPIGKSSFVGGINVNGDRYNAALPTAAAIKSLKNNYVGIFGQFNWHASEKTTVEAGLRTDHHQVNGFFVLPRFAVFQRFNSHWASRAGFGMGYKVPNPLAPQNVDISLLSLAPMSQDLKAEKAYGGNLEFNYRKTFGHENSLFINQAFFVTEIADPLIFRTNAANKYALFNASKSVLTSGLDTYIQMTINEWELYAGYTFTKPMRRYTTPASFVPLTPQHRFAFTLVKEFGTRARFGLEGSYTGRQHREDDSLTPGYLFMAAMVSYKPCSWFTVVLNGENLLDARQSRTETLFTGTIDAPQFKPLWGPIDGRVINLAFRFQMPSVKS